MSSQQCSIRPAAKIHISKRGDNAWEIHIDNEIITHVVCYRVFHHAGHVPVLVVERQLPLTRHKNDMLVSSITRYHIKELRITNE